MDDIHKSKWRFHFGDVKYIDVLAMSMIDAVNIIKSHHKPTDVNSITKVELI